MWGYYDMFFAESWGQFLRSLNCGGGWPKVRKNIFKIPKDQRLKFRVDVRRQVFKFLKNLPYTRRIYE